MFLPTTISRRHWFAVFLAAALCTNFAGLPARAIIINGEGPPDVTGIYDRFIAGLRKSGKAAPSESAAEGPATTDAADERIGAGISGD